MKVETIPITVQPPPFFRDHHTNGRPVLAAVEAMELLTADACRRFPESNGRRLSQIRFDKFLYLEASEALAAFHRVERSETGCLHSSLTSRFQAPRSKITRTLEHASLTMGASPPAPESPPVEWAASLSGIITVVESEHIYAELVPFGPAYRNITGQLLISPDGAMARVGSPRPLDPRENLHLGSPYVLDAAFHAACVWCQRYCGSVAFPVSIRQRTIVSPTRLDGTYTARVVPVQTQREPFAFDIFIYDDDARLCEAAAGVHMRDVSGGRNRPPRGFFQPVGTDPLSSLSNRVLALVLLERNALAPFAAAALSEREKQRLAPMTAKRAAGYLGARLALKRISRQLSGNDDHRESREIETVSADGATPPCPLADGSRPYCSVAHDRRFTLAAAADRPVGVDVEPLSPKALTAMHLYMHAEEMELIQRAPLDQEGTALRMWGVKEAAAKALGIELADAWERVRVTAVSAESSRLTLKGMGNMQAVHATLEDHLFTLLAVDDPS